MQIPYHSVLSTVLYAHFCYAGLDASTVDPSVQGVSLAAVFDAPQAPPARLDSPRERKGEGEDGGRREGEGSARVREGESEGEGGGEGKGEGEGVGG